jgi:hypothetical protein
MARKCKTNHHKKYTRIKNCIIRKDEKLKSDFMPEYVPVEIVERMSEKGMSELEIVDSLRLRGFAGEQIDRAIRIALKEGVLGKHGVASRPHVGAGPARREINRRPEGIEKPIEPVLQRPISSENAPNPVSMKKPPEEIALPEHLKPMEIPAPEMKPALPQPVVQQPQMKPAMLEPIRPQMKPATPVMKPIMESEFGKMDTSFKPPEPSQPEPQTMPQTIGQPIGKPMQQPAQSIPTSSQSYRQDITLEELVEGVVKDQIGMFGKSVTNVSKKTQEFSERIDGVEGKMVKLAKLSGSKNKEVNTKVDELTSAISTMDGRLSALEVAFKSLAKYFKK